ncbi:expressed unknown protein [Seminavis robusta]|uniref:Uncharacterized protein n=1 Tax=Seminavis robusta TaxID=568900 RepID=A0A9N8HW71_9STRA|nr:expressed unknown protein [Seminavis robusta]|eukprot:Sro2145_g316360.1 n/a (355) ;mRNA; r:9480-10544
MSGSAGGAPEAWFMGDDSGRNTAEESNDDNYYSAIAATVQHSAATCSASSSEQNSQMRRQEERFRLFIQVLMKFLKTRDPRVHSRAKQVIEECVAHHKRGYPGYESVTACVSVHLKPVVGDAYWKRAEQQLSHQLLLLTQTTKQKEEWKNLPSSTATDTTCTATRHPGAPSQQQQHQNQQPAPSALDSTPAHPPHDVPSSTLAAAAVVQPIPREQKWKRVHPGASSVAVAPATQPTARPAASQYQQNQQYPTPSVSPPVQYPPQNQPRPMGPPQNENFRMFVRVLLKRLEDRDPRLHSRARQLIKECTVRYKRREPGYESVTASVRVHLKRVVGDVYWKRAQVTLAQLLAKEQK